MCELKASDLDCHMPCESGIFEILKFLAVHQILLKAPGAKEKMLTYKRIQMYLPGEIEDIVRDAVHLQDLISCQFILYIYIYIYLYIDPKIL